MNAFLTHVMTIEVPAGLRSWFCFPSYSFARPGSHLFVFFDTIGLVMIRCFCLCLCFWHFVFSSAVRSGPFYFSSFLIFSPPCISYPLAWLDLVSSPLTFTFYLFFFLGDAPSAANLPAFCSFERRPLFPPGLRNGKSGLGPEWCCDTRGFGAKASFYFYILVHWCGSPGPALMIVTWVWGLVCVPRAPRPCRCAASYSRYSKDIV